jgi:ABC-type Na+ efflux pump permease subunit
MSEGSKTGRTLGVFLLIVWMIINLVYFLLAIPNDYQDLNNYIEPMLWIPSIVGLLLMKKWGLALATAVFCITLGTSMFNVIYFGYELNVGVVNGLRVILNGVAAVYLFGLIFRIRFL